MIKLRSLGEALFEVDDGHKVTPGAPLRFGALLYFAVERGKRISRPTLTELLWPGVDEPVARHSLRHLLYTLRSVGVDFADGPHDVELPADCVVLDYEEILGDPATAAREVGEFLPGYAPTFSPAFAEWVEHLRSRIHGRFRAAILRTLGDAKSRSQWTDVEQLARRCLRLDPLNEEATLALAEATALSGGKAAAVAILDRYLGELEAAPRELKVPANVLRTRISERLPAPYNAAADACFIGREEIMADLTRQLNRARAGLGSGCYVWGNAGIGKSRAALELMRVATLQGLRPIRVACQRSDVRRPLGAFADLVPMLQQLPGALGCSPTSRQFLERLTQYRPESPSVADGERDAEFLYASLRQSLFDLVDAVSEEGTLVAIIEDVHWLDRVSAEVVRELIERSESRPLLLVLTARTPLASESPLFGLVRGLTTHELPPLSETSSGRLFLTLLGERGREIDSRALRRHTALAEGNPFFLRELATHWLEHGNTEELPSTLTAAIEERLSRLDFLALRVLQACAMLGKNSTFERLERVLGYARLDLMNSLETLDRAGLLASHDRRTLTKHDLLAEAAAARLSPTAARYCHRQMGLVLEAELDPGQTPDHDASLLWDCARHLQLAGEIERAMKVITQCADQALAVGLARESVEMWERALPMCETDAQRLHVKEHQVIALLAAEEWQRVIDVAAEVRALREVACPGQVFHDDIELAQWEAQSRLGYDLQSLLDCALTCLLDPQASYDHRVRAGQCVLVHAHNLGDPDAMYAGYHVLTRVLNEADAAPYERMIADVIYHSGYGDPQTAVVAARRLVTLARARGVWPGLTRALRWASNPLRYHGPWDEAEILLLESIAISDRFHLNYSASVSATLLAELCFSTGRMDDAKRWLQKSLSGSQRRTYVVAVNSLQLATQIALFENNASDAIRHLTVLRCLPCQACPRCNTLTLALEVGIRLLQGDMVEKELADRFYHDYERSKRGLCQDFSAYMRFRLLDAEGQPQQALRSIAQYVNEDRRERSPLPYYLAEILEASNVVADSKPRLQPAFQKVADASARDSQALST